MKKIGFGIGLCLSVVSVSGQTKDSVAVQYANTITADDLRTHLKIIASDEYEGRETGMKGQKMAAKYIGDYFRTFGLKGYQDKPGNEAHFQHFGLDVNNPHAIDFKIDGETYTFLDDFYYNPAFPDQVVEADHIVFVGYGIEDGKYDSYKGIDVKDKVVLILDGEPYNEKKGKYYLTKSKETSEWSGKWKKKVGVAKKKGAKAVLLVDPDYQKNVKRAKLFIGQPSMKLKGQGKKKVKVGIPSFYISTEMAEKIVGKSNTTTADLRKILNKKGKPYQTTLTSKVELDVKNDQEGLEAENVLGFLEGTDLKDEILVITSHYDHIGAYNGEVFNGADDDGSGTCTLLELAEAFTKAKEAGKGPRRSILFMTVAGEEKGLLGSSYYVDHPIYPLENTIADLNIDMVGRIDNQHENGKYIYIIGSDKLSSELHAISEESNKLYTGIDLDYTYNDPNDPNRFYYRSDHYNFAKNNIPIIFYFSGVHEDYHQATDTWEKIDYDKMATIGQLIFHTAWELANRDERIKVDKVSDFKNK